MNSLLKFQNKTNWYVITGAPSSGKTSVINELAKQGFSVKNEVARELIELGISKGRTLEHIRSDALALQKDILETALAREMGLDPTKIIFLDRGLPDSITYFRRAGLDGIEAVAASYLYQYRAVFIFDRLPIVQDHVRTEDNKIADEIDKALEEDYKSIGYTPIRVPVISIRERTEFILKAVSAI